MRKVNPTKTSYIVLFAILIAISTITVHAHSPELDLTILLNSGTPVIDGTMSTGEWDNAASKTFTMNLPGGGTQPATFFVMADDTNLYFALKYQRDSFDLSNNFGVLFDNAHNGVNSLGDDDLRATDSNSFTDRHVGEGSFLVSDTNDGGTNDGSAARTLASGFITHEMSHPFNSADDSHDISMQVGDTVGLQPSIQLGSTETFFPPGVANGFGDLTLSAQPCNIETAANVDTIISSSCIVTLDVTAGGSVRVENGAVMTIPNLVTLNINFAAKNLTVQAGSGVLIESGGKIT